ncbi:hypothetical protein SDC9_158350 [bioreactor metagenome]|uniref:Uncharacterized protein n=1 Tax=bioreactor metagenome TaxID=1076179 RepID=A0A645FCI0_9ZZZZ
MPLSFHETGIPGQMQMIAQAEDAPLVNRLFAQMGQLPPMREGPQEQAAPTQTPAEKGKQPEKAREEKPSVRDKVQDAKAQRESKAPQEKARAPKAPKKSAPDKGR